MQLTRSRFGDGKKQVILTRSLPFRARTLNLGQSMLAGALYRERGSVDSFASFEAMNIPGNVGSMGQINRLLGVNRSQVA
jgi:hypothetical protein